MAEAAFRFKQFRVFHGRSSLKVGTDAVLLGAWASGSSQVLDAGTGCGVIALMMAQRFPSALVTAIDIDQPSVEEAGENFLHSPFAERLTALQSSLSEFVPAMPFGTIVCNPPFFQVGYQGPDTRRNSARQMHSLTPEDLFLFAAEHLSPDGNLCFIFPADRDFSQQQGKLHLRRQTTVYSKPDGIPVRNLWEFSMQPSGVVRDSIVIETSRHQYTPEYQSLLRDFYLNF